MEETPVEKEETITDDSDTAMAHMPGAGPEPEMPTVDPTDESMNPGLRGPEKEDTVGGETDQQKPEDPADGPMEAMVRAETEAVKEADREAGRLMAAEELDSIETEKETIGEVADKNPDVRWLANGAWECPVCSNKQLNMRHCPVCGFHLDD